MSDHTQAQEIAWRKAHDELDGTPESTIAEQDAWDEYATACGDVNECLVPGCDTVCTDYSYCAEHRELDAEGWTDGRENDPHAGP
jgi:hypothetical protein